MIGALFMRDPAGSTSMSDASVVILYAGLVAARLGGRWRGALIEGPSGVGKSDLALRALEIGFRLVADDRVVVWMSGGRLYGRAPDTLAGRIEVRGLGIMHAPALPMAEVVLVVRAGTPERLPEAAFAGVRRPARAVRPAGAGRTRLEAFRRLRN